jgi:hypothetical protein
VTAQATDNASVADVTFSVNGTDTFTDTSPPYEHVITVPPLASVGATIQVNATARDPSGNTGSSGITLTIVSTPDTESPTVTLHLPSQASPGTNLHIYADTADNVGVASVSFLVNGAAVLTDTESPYGMVYQIPPESTVGTSLAFSARAVDYSNNTKEAGSVLIVQAPDTAPPSVSLSVPGEVVAGGVLLLPATATDNIGVASVAFFVNGVLVATDTQEPYQASFLLTPGINPGAQLLVQAQATDFSGLEAFDSAETLVTAAPIPGRGIITGEVYDDSTGLPVEAAAIQLLTFGRKSTFSTCARGGERCSWALSSRGCHGCCPNSHY